LPRYVINRKINGIVLVIASPGRVLWGVAIH
jgi:hypothetical protein